MSVSRYRRDSVVSGEERDSWDGAPGHECRLVAFSWRGHASVLTLRSRAARARVHRVGRDGRRPEHLLVVQRQRQGHAGAGPRLDLRLVVVGRAGAGAVEEVPCHHARSARTRPQRRSCRRHVLDGSLRPRGRGGAGRGACGQDRARRPQHGRAGHPPVRAALPRPRGGLDCRGRPAGHAPVPGRVQAAVAGRAGRAQGARRHDSRHVHAADAAGAAAADPRR